MRKFAVLGSIAALAFVVALPASAQSLAEAAKKAQEDRAKGMGWPAPVPPKEIAPGATPIEPATSSDTPAATASPSTSFSDKPVKKDEAYWKGRMRTVTTKLSDDKTLLTAAEISERALNDQVHQSLDSTGAILDRRQRAVLENQWQDAVKEMNRLKALVMNDERAKADLELEAHRAGVPPGWLILE